jgi:hypothetical protein
MTSTDAEKGSFQTQSPVVCHPTGANMRNASWTRLRRVVIVVLLFILSTLLYRGSSKLSRARSQEPGDLSIRQKIIANPSIPFSPDSDGSGLVPLEAHIMSKCPDARDCLKDLIVPAMEKISDKVDFRLSFIGRYVSLFLLPAATLMLLLRLHSISKEK